MNSVLVSFVAKQAISNAFVCGAAFSNVSAAISCFTPAPADRLHYAHRLPGGGLDINEA